MNPLLPLQTDTYYYAAASCYLSGNSLAFNGANTSLVAIIVAFIMIPLGKSGPRPLYRAKKPLVRIAVTTTQITSNEHVASVDL